MKNKLLHNKLRPNSTLCDVHNFIISYLEDLKDCISQEDDYRQDIINELTVLTHIAKNIGQSMEDRLYLYRTAIENLGFERVKK